MAKLTEAAKTFIVQGLATYRTPSEVAEAVKEAFGLQVHRAQVAQYDPEGSHAGDLAQRWKELHAATRAAFTNRIAEIGIAQRSFRLRELEDNYRALKRMKNLPAANAVLEQAAKEVGDTYTNRREVTGKGGKDLMPPPAPNPLAGLSPEQIQTALRDAVSKF